MADEYFAKSSKIAHKSRNKKSDRKSTNLSESLISNDYLVDISNVTSDCWQVKINDNFETTKLIVSKINKNKISKIKRKIVNKVPIRINLKDLRNFSEKWDQSESENGDSTITQPKRGKSTQSLQRNKPNTELVSNEDLALELFLLEEGLLFDLCQKLLIQRQMDVPFQDFYELLNDNTRNKNNIENLELSKDTNSKLFSLNNIYQSIKTLK